MGICLGLQLLLTESEEFGSSKGLNLIEGVVKRFSNADTEGSETMVTATAFDVLAVQLVLLDETTTR